MSNLPLTRTVAWAKEPASRKDGKGDKAMSSTTYIGIDVSKDELEVFLSSTGEHQTVANTESGVSSLIPLLPSADQKLIVLEATGGLEKPAVEALTTAGFPVAVVNP